MLFTFGLFFESSDLWIDIRRYSTQLSMTIPRSSWTRVWVFARAARV